MLLLGQVTVSIVWLLSIRLLLTLSCCTSPSRSHMLPFAHPPALCSTVARIGSFVYAGERLTRRLRVKAFRAALRQEVAWFELPVNSVGRLSTRLQADAAEVKGGTGEGLSLVFQSSAAIIAGVVIAFDANWRLALVVVSVMPLMIAAFLLQSRLHKGLAMGGAKSLEESGHIAVEATSAIKTVTSFGMQVS